MIREILKYPSLKKIDYLELDPLILKMVKKFSTPLTQAELADPRVNIKYIDGRLFLKKYPFKYDLILVGLSYPSDLQINRLFSREFFSLAKKRLSEEGLLVLQLPGSLTYLSEELRNLNSCILYTLKEVFPYVSIVPGDGTNLFLAGSSQTATLKPPRELYEALLERKIPTLIFSLPYLEYRLAPRWLDWFLRSLEGASKEINADSRPRGVFYSLAYWNALFSPCIRKAFNSIEKISLAHFLVLFSLFTFIFLGLRFKLKRLSFFSVPFCIATTGFAGMIFDLVLIFGFQALYGYVFHWLGLLVTSFMVGVAAGSFIIIRFLDHFKKRTLLFLKIEATLILFSLILPLILSILSPYLDKPAVFFFLRIIFLLFSFSAGFLIGAEFPLASSMYLTAGPSSSIKLSSTAGLLYSCDLVGGWIGGVIGGVMLLPVLGLWQTCLLVGMLKLSSFVILLSSRRCLNQG